MFPERDHPDQHQRSL